MRAWTGIAFAALAAVLAACSLASPFGYRLLFGTSGGYQLGPAVVHAVAVVFGDIQSVGLGDIADDGDFFLTLDDSPGSLVSLVGPGASLEFASACTLTSFDISDAEAAGLFVQRLAVLKRPGLVSGLDDPLGILRSGSSPTASRLFSQIGAVAASAEDKAQSRYYVDRAVRLIGTCSLGNSDITVDLDFSEGWNPLLLTVDRIGGDGRIKASYTSDLASDLIWYLD